ncbi:hypothetical protein MHM582_2577 [Microbacterium sp. HM58-2]|nr:hypothetical protein MHM582_2577 [Microbacterium sp. HM58-2]
MKGDVREERIRAVTVVPIMTEQHVRQLVQNELLPVQHGVGARVKNEILGLTDQPDSAQPVTIAKLWELDNSKSASPVFLHGPEQVCEREESAQPELCDCRRCGLLDVHT